MQGPSLLPASSLLGWDCGDASGNGGNGSAIVIGSGFAGWVAALRLGQAGIAATVLERGQQWTLPGPDTFPTTTNFDRCCRVAPPP